MPSPAVWGLEWLNANALRSYPLADSATKLDQSSSFRIPDTIILSLYFPVNAGVNVVPENFFIYSMSMFSTGLTLVLGYLGSNNSVTAVASTSMAFSAHTENKSYALVGIDSYSDSVGKIVFGKLEEIKALPAGQYFFDYAGGKLDTDCIRPIIRGVTSITLVNGNDRSEKLTGAIELIAGTNIALTYSQQGTDAPKIRFDAVSGEGLTKDCVCTDEASQSPCIRTINGIAPTPEGNFTLQTDTNVSLDAKVNGLQVNDLYSKPCCGCQELEAVTNDLQSLQNSALSLSNYISRLDGSVTAMTTTVLGSKLNDTGCESSSAPL